MEAVLDQKPTADAQSMAEHRALRKEQSATPAVKQAPIEKPSEPPAGDKSAAESKIAESSEDTDKKSTQENEHQKRDRSFEGRISELSGRAKAEKDRADRAEEALREYRTRKPAEPASVTDTKPEPVKADAEPKVDDFKTYEEYVRAIARWEAKQLQEDARAESRKADDTRKASEAQAQHQVKIAKTKEKYSDFDDVVQAGIKLAENVRNAGMEAALHESEDTGELVYYLAKNMDEYRRIAALSPTAAYRAMVQLELKLASPGEQKKPPEQPKPLQPVLVSRAPRPPTPVGGTESSPKATAEANSMAEHRALRKAARG